MTQKASRLAISSLVSALLCVPFTPIILGHVARLRIKKNPKMRGGGVALTGLIIGYVQLVAILIFLLLSLPTVLGTANSLFGTSDQSAATESIEAAANDTSTNVIMEEGRMDQSSAPEVLPEPEVRGLASNSFFGTSGLGNKFVFIIDKSSSMDGQRFTAAKKELCRTLTRLTPKNQFMIYFFSNHAEAMPTRGIMTGTPKNIRFAVSWVRTRSASGGTDPEEALKNCFKLGPDTIWLLTDGEFHDDREVIQTIKKGNFRLKARINTIALGEDIGVDILKRIAKENGGNYRFVKNSN